MTKEGFFYYVNDDPLRRFARLTGMERLRWLDEARRLVLSIRTPAAALRQERLRSGAAITAGVVPDR